MPTPEKQISVLEDQVEEISQIQGKKLLGIMRNKKGEKWRADSGDFTCKQDELQEEKKEKKEQHGHFSWFVKNLESED